ncbi:MAG: FmdB family transcriptional regulator [Chloroflexi bacterium]|nr:FmdB family transcriptional regulator [Chloroflexota bacterium]
MPLYTYACGACGQEIEKRQGFHDAPLTTCDACGGELRRVLHPVGIVFKGSGFYNTDYKNGSSKAAGGETPADKTADAKPGTDTNGTTGDGGSEKPAAATSDTSKSAKPAAAAAPAEKAS